MEIMEMARLLGLAIKESDAGKRVEACKNAYEENEQIIALTTECDVQQKALAALAGDKDTDPNLISSIQTRITEIYEEVLATDAYKNYEKAQNELNELVTRVNATMMAQVTGQVSEGCTHDCSTCGGCH